MVCFDFCRVFFLTVLLCANITARGVGCYFRCLEHPQYNRLFVYRSRNLPRNAKRDADYRSDLGRDGVCDAVLAINLYF